MRGITIAIVGLVFCLVQLFILSKLKKVWIKYLPMEVAIGGLMFCLIGYLNIFWTNTPSVVSENQYLSVFLFVPFSGAFIGCILGIIIFQVLSKR